MLMLIPLVAVNTYCRMFWLWAQQQLIPDLSWVCESFRWWNMSLMRCDERLDSLYKPSHTLPSLTHTLLHVDMEAQCSFSWNMIRLSHRRLPMAADERGVGRWWAHYGGLRLSGWLKGDFHLTALTAEPGLMGSAVQRVEAENPCVETFYPSQQIPPLSLTYFLSLPTYFQMPTSKSLTIRTMYNY